VDFSAICLIAPLLLSGLEGIGSCGIRSAFELGEQVYKHHHFVASAVPGGKNPHGDKSQQGQLTTETFSLRRLRRETAIGDFIVKLAFAPCARENAKIGCSSQGVFRDLHQIQGHKADATLLLLKSVHFVADLAMQEHSTLPGEVSASR
jgi:hypothetical protein